MRVGTEEVFSIASKIEEETMLLMVCTAQHIVATFAMHEGPLYKEFEIILNDHLPCTADFASDGSGIVAFSTFDASL